MRAITIRDVPDEVVDELAGRAARGGRSLQEYLRLHLIGLAARPDLNHWLDQVHVRKQVVGVTLEADEILGARDADRR